MGREHLQARGTAVRGLSARLGAFSALAGGVAVLVGGLVLVGWALDVGVLKRVLPNLVAMNPATAVGFVLAGVSLSLLRPGRRPGGSARGAARAIAAGCAFLVCLIGFVKLVQISLGLEVGIDGLLFPRGLEAEAATTGLPNRMAPNTAFNFLLVGTSLLLLDRPTRRGLWPAQWLALLSATASALALVGYLFGAEALYGVSAYIPMALHTAVTFILVSTGVLAARPDRGLAALVGGQGLVEELIVTFQKDAASRLEALREAARRGEAPAVRRLARALKGSCGSMGVTEMTRLLTAIEKAGASGDLSLARGLLGKLEDEFGRVRTALEAERMV